MKKLLITLCVAIFLTATSAFGWFDATPGYFKEFDGCYMDYQDDPSTFEPRYIDMYGSVSKIHAFGFAEGLMHERDDKGKVTTKRVTGPFAQEGSGFYVGNGYWVTNSHVVKPEHITVPTSKHVSMIVRITNIQSRIISIGSAGIGNISAEIVYIDDTTDIAILRTIGNYLILEDYGYRISKTVGIDGDLLFAGMPVAVIVEKRTPRDITRPWHPFEGVPEKTGWFEVRYGKILAPEPTLPPGTPNRYLSWLSMNDVPMDTLIYPGDSGSPVFGFIDGNPVLIGIARAIVRHMDENTGEMEVVYYFTRIDFVERFVIETK